METLTPSGLIITQDAPQIDEDDQLNHAACGNCYRKAKGAGLPITAYCGKQRYHWPRIPREGPKPCIVCTYYINERVPCRSCGLAAN